MRMLIPTLTLAALMLSPLLAVAQDAKKDAPAGDKAAAKADEKPASKADEKAPSTEHKESQFVQPPIPTPKVCLLFGFAITICAVAAKMVNKESNTLNYVVLAAIALSAIMYAYSYKLWGTYEAAVLAEQHHHSQQK